MLTAKWVRSIYTTSGQAGKMARNAGFRPVFTPKMPAKMADFSRQHGGPTGAIERGQRCRSAEGLWPAAVAIVPRQQPAPARIGNARQSPSGAGANAHAPANYQPS